MTPTTRIAGHDAERHEQRVAEPAEHQLLDDRRHACDHARSSRRTRRRGSAATCRASAPARGPGAASGSRAKTRRGRRRAARPCSRRRRFHDGRAAQREQIRRRSRRSRARSASMNATDRRADRRRVLVEHVALGRSLRGAARVLDRRSGTRRGQPEQRAASVRPYDAASMCPRRARSLPTRLTARLRRCVLVAERMVAIHARLRELQGEQREPCGSSPGTASGYAVSDGAARRVLRSPRRELDACVQRARGARRAGRRILDTGLLDFPADPRRRGGSSLLARGRGFGRVVARPRGGLRRPPADRLG